MTNWMKIVAALIAVAAIFVAGITPQRCATSATLPR